MFSLGAREDFDFLFKPRLSKGKGGSEMKTFFLAAGIACFLGAVLAEESTQKQKSMTPTMISFTDLKWVELAR